MELKKTWIQIYEKLLKDSTSENYGFAKCSSMAASKSSKQAALRLPVPYRIPNYCMSNFHPFNRIKNWLYEQEYATKIPGNYNKNKNM